MDAHFVVLVFVFAAVEPVAAVAVAGHAADDGGLAAAAAQ